MQPDADQTPPKLPIGRRVTVREAAQRLNTTVEGIRSRIKRGTLTKEKGEDGTVYVLLGPDQTSPDDAQGADQTNDLKPPENTALWKELMAEMRSQNEHLRSELAIRNEELRRKDHIIAALTDRIPELEPAREASPEPRGSSTPPSEEEADTPAIPERPRPGEALLVAQVLRDRLKSRYTRGYTGSSGEDKVRGD
jgi:hypothetical protein